MPLAALREILEAADFRPGGTPDIRGADPVLRTRYRVGAAGAAALGAVGLAADHLWQLRGGRAQRVAVTCAPLRHRCAARATCASTARRRSSGTR